MEYPVERMTISVIVPALNEGDEIEATLASARDTGVCEVVVVDGGSCDGTVARATPLADRVISSAPGRALQMNTGAGQARGDVLLFLHADTRLPAGFARAVLEALQGGAVGGRFDVELRGSHPLLPVIAWAISLRSRVSRIATGDQAIFVRRDVFSNIGGFPALPLMEDVAFSIALRRMGEVACLRSRVSTSARRWEQHGLARTVLLMWWLRFAYACGVSPFRLARSYARR
jgi:rSAM/selenodomain-associated transferase 2